mmetsp:Transcript_45106/g.109731  ORF Transcript_45106/g.109731 Transcript_45106/m.109731 type:complete len:235 (+) Transcript_45106:3457-4161(+)
MVPKLSPNDSWIDCRSLGSTSACCKTLFIASNAALRDCTIAALYLEDPPFSFAPPPSPSSSASTSTSSSSSSAILIPVFSYKASMAASGNSCIWCSDVSSNCSRRSRPFSNKTFKSSVFNIVINCCTSSLDATLFTLSVIIASGSSGTIDWTTPPIRLTVPSVVPSSLPSSFVNFLLATFSSIFCSAIWRAWWACFSLYVLAFVTTSCTLSSFQKLFVAAAASSPRVINCINIG